MKGICQRITNLIFAIKNSEQNIFNVETEKYVHEIK